MGFPILVRCHLYIGYGHGPCYNRVNLPQNVPNGHPIAVRVNSGKFFFRIPCLIYVSPFSHAVLHVSGLVQERRKSIANAMELCLSCINPSV